MKQLNISIIGAGIGGLATAIRLATAGHAVTVYESNAYPGGKLTEINCGDYRFDAGPSLFTMPQYMEELFQLAGRDIATYFQYERLNVICHYFWEDGMRLKAYAEPQKFADEVADKLGVPAERITDTLAASAKKYALTGTTFLEKSLHQKQTWFNKEVAATLLNIPMLTKAVFQSMHHDNQQRLQHPKLVQLFDRFATYNGSNPYQAPGMLNIIPHFEHNLGAYFPKGGMHEITKALYQLALDLKVSFHLNQSVEQILVTHGQATGIRVLGVDHPFDKVISNMDVFPTYKKLLADQQQPHRTLSQPRSTSALIFYWGIKNTFKELGLHNILFSKNYKKEFDALDDGRIDDDPTIYINISKKHEAEDAPDGCENWFTMINVPANDGQDWSSLIATAREKIIAKINRTLNIDLASLIECEEQLDPRTIESRTSSYQGALYGTNSNNIFAAFLRHPNFSGKISNLYFCGGSVHPGGGIPLCLLSGKIVSELIQKGANNV